MIENKKKLFAHGLQIFIDMVCAGSQLAYTKAMVHHDGYRHAAQEFYKKSGYMKADERDELFQNGVIPEWMTDVFMKTEQHNFNITLWDKQ